MTIGADEPEEEGQDEYLADDDTPVSEVSADDKRGRGRPTGLTAVESDKLSEEIWESYAGGMNAREIGDLHGMTRQAVWARIRRYRAKVGIEDINEAKALDLGRHEALIERLWSKIMKDPQPEDIRSYIMIMEQRSRLLGLAAPKKLQVDGQMSLTPSPAMVHHLDRIMEERERLAGPPLTPAIEGGGDGDIVDAEIIDDSG